MPRGIKSYILVVLLSSFYLCSYAQVNKDWSVYLYAKSHNFYDSGVYELRESNNATGYGLGFSIKKPITKRLSISAGYSYALADSLNYNNQQTSNAVFHQIETNINFDILKIWRIQSGLFSGYTYNHLQQIDQFGFKNGGMSINLGTGLLFDISDKVDLAYKLTYGFSLNESIPYNFRNQLGFVFGPSIFKRQKDVKIGSNKELLAVQDLNEKLQLENLKLKSKVDSVAKSPKVITMNPEKEDKSVIVTYNNELLDKIKYLEQDNQLLLEEIRSKRSFTDSIYSESFKGYTIINTKGQVQVLESKNLPTGYYLYATGLKTLGNAVTLSKTEVMAKLSPIHFLNRKDEFYVLGFIGAEDDVAQKVYTSLGEDRFLYSIIKL